MSKANIVRAVASSLGIPLTQANKTVDAVAEAIFENVGTTAVRIPPLGTFKVKHRAERKGKNPRTGESLTIAARDELTFKAAR